MEEHGMARLLAALMALVFCSAVLAGDVAKVTAKDDGGTAVKAKGGVVLEGAEITPAQAAKIRTEGAHRWFDAYMTHNMHDLKIEIDLLNLQNSLYLSDVQISHLLVVATKAERARRAALKQAEPLNTQLERSLAQVRKEMLATGKPKCETSAMKQVSDVQGKVSEINTALSKQLVEHPTRALQAAIKGMLPHNRLGRAMMKKLRIYATADHPHQAQSPKPLEF